MDIEEIKRNLQDAITAIYSEDAATFLRGANALGLLEEVLQLEGASKEEIAQLVAEARRRALDKGVENG